MARYIIFPGTLFLIFIFAFLWIQEKTPDFPAVTISNKMVKMKLYLPDIENGYYRATRFDWSGIISSATYNGHEYFGYWKKTHDPMVHEDLSGPVESYNKPGLGFDDATPGGKFVRIGVGVIERPDDKPYETFKTYPILDHGNWTVGKGKDWVSFRQELETDIGYSYVYTKTISLKKQESGFTITHHLVNTGTKKIETDQYNHNFFIIDGEKTGPAIRVTFPFELETESDLKGLVELDGKELKFLKDLNKESVWMEFSGIGPAEPDQRIKVENQKTGAGVIFGVNRPLYRMVFWACGTTYCPENFIMISVDPGAEDTWVSDYTFTAD